LIHFYKRLIMLQLLLLMSSVFTIQSTSAIPSVLVLLENLSLKESHSMFFTQVEKQGFSLDFKVADDPTIAIKKYGQYLYDHLLIFAPTVEEFGGTLNSETIIEFIDDGGNVMMAGSSNTGEILKDIASECGFEADEEGTFVIDHLNFDARDAGQHTMIVSDPANLVKSEKIVGAAAGGAPLLYQGVGLLTDQENPLVINILTGSSTSYSHNPEEKIKDYPHATGKNTVLIAGLQARNNARVVLSGSLDFFSDAFFTAEVSKVGSVSGNSVLAKSLVSWTFHQSGVIRIDSVDHKLVSGEVPEFYTVNEEAEFSVKMSELVDGSWIPFNGEDVQFEFVRIDPFVRQTMTNNKGRLSVQFKVPDVYGVFKFVVNHNRLGLSRVHTSTQVSVHPLRHNQYERFIPAAYPYYASSFSMMAGVFVFAMVFLHFKEEAPKAKAE